MWSLIRLAIFALIRGARTTENETIADHIICPDHNQLLIETEPSYAR